MRGLRADFCHCLLEIQQRRSPTERVSAEDLSSSFLCLLTLLDVQELSNGHSLSLRRRTAICRRFVLWIIAVIIWWCHRHVGHLEVIRAVRSTLHNTRVWSSRATVGVTQLLAQLFFHEYLDVCCSFTVSIHLDLSDHLPTFFLSQSLPTLHMKRKYLPV